VGWQEDPRFEDGAFDAIFSASAGIPRRINTLCNRVLLASYLAEKHAIGAADIESVVAEIRQELGPGAVGAGGAAPTTVQTLNGAVPGSSEALLGVEDRLGRLERTMTATIDLLHQLLHRDRHEKPRDKAAS
jgi:hypothetical protein